MFLKRKIANKNHTKMYNTSFETLGKPFITEGSLVKRYKKPFKFAQLSFYSVIL